MLSVIAIAHSVQVDRGMISCSHHLQSSGCVLLLWLAVLHSYMSPVQ